MDIMNGLGTKGIGKGTRRVKPSHHFPIGGKRMNDLSVDGIGGGDRLS